MGCHGLSGWVFIFEWMALISPVGFSFIISNLEFLHGSHNVILSTKTTAETKTGAKTHALTVALASVSLFIDGAR